MAQWKSRFATRRPGRLVVVAAIAAIVPMLTGMALPSPDPAGPGPARPLPVRAEKPVPVYAVRSRRLPVARTHTWHPAPVSWPAGRTVTVDVTQPDAAPAAKAGPRTLRPATATVAAMARPSPGSARAGSLPLWVGPEIGGKPRGGAADVRTMPITVTMAARRLAVSAGITGVVFTLARPAGAGTVAGANSTTATVHVSLGYRGFEDAYGGGYGARLRLVELPACVLTSPREAACRKMTPLLSTNNAITGQLGANVVLPVAGASARSATSQLGGAAAGTQVVLAATTATSGSTGNFGVPALSEAGSWQAGGSSGAFTYSYPIGVPPVPGGLEPAVSLGYNSQTVDALTSSTNDQASWVGDGWDYSPGFIERDYETCSADSLSPALPSADKTGDLCWSDNNVVTLSLNGTSSTLVDDPTTGWHSENDGGEQISYLTGSGANGTHDDDYWVVTTANGTSYYFGLNELPGWKSGDLTTNSAWTVPVYSPRSTDTDGCYKSTFSSCPEAWRWNLDYVTDPHGDAIAYFYNTETNYYGADGATTGTASYVRAGALSAIWYGFRAGSLYSGTSPAGAGEVTFGAATTRTDVPTDLSCTKSGACQVNSPSFWTSYQLTSITTYGLDGTKMDEADSWALTQDFDNPGDNTTFPPLWLESIQQTGQDGSTAIKLPPVSFSAVPLPNRVETQTDLNDGYPIIERMRLASVTNETGAVTGVTYDDSTTSCTSGNFPAEDDNTTVCFPDYWVPPGQQTPIEDWFNKYVVTAVTQQNTAGGGQTITSTYCYGAAPGCLSGAAWHYNDDALTRESQRTWDEWRGFATVTTETGTAPDPVTETVDRYLQGMNGDEQSGGGTSSASFTSTVGDVTVPDSDQYAGMLFEHTVYDGAGGAIVSDTVNTPWTSAATATYSWPSSDDLPNLNAYLTGTAETQVFTAMASGGYREADTFYTYDSYGQVTDVEKVPDAYDNGVAGDASEDTCTTTTYAYNTATSVWLLDLPKEVLVTSVPPGKCPLSGAATSAGLVSDDLYFYDGATSLTSEVPTTGNLTQTQEATSWNGSSEVYTTETTTAYDEYGRVTSATNADGDITTTSYSPATGAEPTSVAVTAPGDLVTTTAYDPLRELPVSVTNPAGWVTSTTYDALGRETAQWTPGHPEASDPADTKYTYSISNTEPSVITKETINDTGTYAVSEDLYNSLGDVIETQTATPDGNRDIADEFYNSDGQVYLEYAPYYTSGAPSATLVGSPAQDVPSEVGYTYDGAGRLVTQTSYSAGTATWDTTTSYGGNYTTVAPPTGGTATTTYVNGDGLTSYVYQYHSATPPSSPPAPGSGSQSGTSGWDQTAYTYTAAGQLASVTDAAGNKWTYGYDLAGSQTSANDPDSGATTSTYDNDGNLVSSKNATGQVISFKYDADGRKTGEYDATVAGQSASNEVASWVYDTLAKGQLTSSTSYTDGDVSGEPYYTEAVTGYNAYGLPSGQETVVSSGPLAGTYKRGLTYTSYGDLLSSYYDYGAGGLPAETVSTGYDTSNEPVSVGSSLWSYVSELSYTELGQPQEYTFGTTNEPAWMLDTYYSQTGLLDTSVVQAGVSPVTADDTTYDYDDSGDITAEIDAPAGGPTQVQCFQHDYLGRLQQAWSQGGTSCAASPSQSAEAAAAAPYWDSYTYNDENDLTAEVSTPPTGAATTYTNSFPAAQAAQPHAISSQQVSGPGGDTTTNYSYNADGQTTSISGSSGAQTLSWNAAGQIPGLLNSITEGSDTTSYIYDASGNLLLQTDNSTTTLYLPDEQVTDANGNISAVRYYAIGGVTVAVRTSAGDVQYLTGNQQGTATTAIDYSSLAVTRRYYDPFGNPVGSQPSSWPGDKGFVGGTSDSVTGLTNLGAREYNPATGSFVSPDAMLTPGSPQDLNPYAYASDNPASLSDPTGLSDLCDGEGQCGSLAYFKQHPAPESNSTPPSRSAWLDEPVVTIYGGTGLPRMVYRDLKQFLGYNGSREFTVQDALTWLKDTGELPAEEQAKVWQAFCNGLAGDSVQQCNYDPFIGAKLTDGGMSGRTLIQGGILVAGIFAGAACNGILDEDTGGGAAFGCNAGAATIINLAGVAAGGQWTSSRVMIGAITGLMQGFASYIPAAWDAVKAANGIETTSRWAAVGSYAFSVTSGGALSIMQDAADSGSITFRSAVIDLGLSAVGGLPAPNIVDFADSVQS
jgi:RHS repeat-associated protein